MDDAWQKLSDGVRVRVRLTPKADRDALTGFRATSDGQALEARVRAIPEDGKANTALRTLLATALGVSASALVLERGATGRIKIWHAAGEPERLDAVLQTLQEKIS